MLSPISRDRSVIETRAVVAHQVYLWAVYVEMHRCTAPIVFQDVRMLFLFDMCTFDPIWVIFRAPVFKWPPSEGFVLRDTMCFGVVHLWRRLACDGTGCPCLSGARFLSGLLLRSPPQTGRRGFHTAGGEMFPIPPHTLSGSESSPPEATWRTGGRSLRCGGARAHRAPGRRGSNSRRVAFLAHRAPALLIAHSALRQERGADLWHMLRRSSGGSHQGRRGAEGGRWARQLRRRSGVDLGATFESSF